MAVQFTIREGRNTDSYNVFLVFEETFYNLQSRINQKPPIPWDQPEKLAAIWHQRQSLYQHLAVHVDQFWVAEHQSQVVGFARTILHDGVRELTEFFVKPNMQGSGVGRALLSKALPKQSGVKISIVASPDIAAQVLYFKADVPQRFMIMYFGKKPAAPRIPETYSAEIMTASRETHTFLDTADRKVLGFTRRDTHEYLLKDRTLYKYLRPDGKAAGYGYIGEVSGPFALEAETDYGPVLRLAEAEAARRGRRHFGLEVPMVNHHAVNSLLTQGFRIDPFHAVYMSSDPLPLPQNYILTSPPFVV